MKNYLDQLPPEFQNLMHLAATTASLRGMRVYLVGGFVRDLILGAANLDLDLVVEGDGIVFAEDLAVKLKARLIRHRQFGTATVISREHIKIDVATARKEIYVKPAALPEVEFGTLRDDLKRRDFTINAMAIDITANSFGRLIDFFSGKDDLLKERVRILHEKSFIDDPTRILRAVRFEQRYDFEIEPATLRLFKDAVKNKMLEIIEPQRLRNEIILMLKEENFVLQIKRLQQLTKLNFIKKGFSLIKKDFDLLVAVQKQVKWFKRAFRQRRLLDIWLMYFLALLDRLDKKEANAVCAKFVLRKGEEKRIISFKSISKQLIIKLSTKNIKGSEIYRLLEPLSYEVILVLKAKYKNPLFAKHIEDFLEIYNGMRVYVSGHDLHVLGVVPGPNYQKIFSHVLNAKLNGQVKTLEEELELIRKLILKKK